MLGLLPILRPYEPGPGPGACTAAATAAAQLRQRIEAGEWKPGEQIPGVSQLSARYGVSRTTVQKAVRMLVTDGLVVTRHGWGAFVGS